MANLVAEEQVPNASASGSEPVGSFDAVAGWPSTGPNVGAGRSHELPGLGAGHAFAVRDREDLLGAISVEMPPRNR